MSLAPYLAPISEYFRSKPGAKHLLHNDALSKNSLVLRNTFFLRALLATTSPTSVTTPSLTAVPAPDPGLLASLLQSAGITTTAAALQPFYYPNPQTLLVQQLALQPAGQVLEAQLLLAVEACQSPETQQGLEKRRRIVQELDTLVKQWVWMEGMRQGLHWGEGEQAGGKVVTYGSSAWGLWTCARTRPASSPLPTGPPPSRCPGRWWSVPTCRRM